MSVDRFVRVYSRGMPHANFRNGVGAVPCITKSITKDQRIVRPGQMPISGANPGIDSTLHRREDAKLRLLIKPKSTIVFPPIYCGIEVSSVHCQCARKPVQI